MLNIPKAIARKQGKKIKTANLLRTRSCQAGQNASA